MTLSLRSVLRPVAAAGGLPSLASMDGRTLLDPEIATLAGEMPLPVITQETLEMMRSVGFAGVVELSDEVERVDHVVSTDPEVVVRVHRRRGVEGALPCVYSIHGGGYILGNRAMDDLRFDRWCQQFPLVGVSVEYRLAPETPYPGRSTTAWPAWPGSSTTPASSASIPNGSGSPG